MPQKIVYEYLCRSSTFIIEEYKGGENKQTTERKGGVLLLLLYL